MSATRLTVTRTTPYDELPDLLRPEEFAAAACVSRGVVYELVRTGKLPVVRFGTKLFRVPKSALRESK